jgi:hypothetical protein
VSTRASATGPRLRSCGVSLLRSRPLPEDWDRSGPAVGRDRRASRENPPRLWTAVGHSRICMQGTRGCPIRRPMDGNRVRFRPVGASDVSVPAAPAFRDGSRPIYTSSNQRNPVELLAEEFLERKRHGEKPTLSEYLDRHPELAQKIRDLFPALLMMEDLGDSSGAATGLQDGDGTAPSPPGWSDWATVPFFGASVMTTFHATLTVRQGAYPSSPCSLSPSSAFPLHRRSWV